MYEKREMRSSTWGGVGAKVIVSNGNKSVVGNHSPVHKFDWLKYHVWMQLLPQSPTSKRLLAMKNAIFNYV